jgi:cystathionine gamma-synthase
VAKVLSTATNAPPARATTAGTSITFKVGFVGVRNDALAERLGFLQNAAGAVPGPMDCFLTMRGLKTLAVRIAAATEIFTLAESLGGVESLIEVPQAMTHQSVEGSAAAVPADLVRLSCGIEAAEDLVEDLRRAI